MISSRYRPLRSEHEAEMRKEIVRAQGRMEREWEFPESDGNKLVQAIFRVFCDEHQMLPSNNKTEEIELEIERQIRKTTARLRFEPPGFWDEDLKPGE
jgi:hypothetical protein